jgi:lysophospholipase L1-like esterase
MTSRLLLVGLLSTLLASACGSTPPTTPTPNPPTDPGPTPQPPVPPTLGITQILSFGDSMTAGTTSAVFPGLSLTAGLPQSYPFKLQALLAARYSKQTMSVLNAGVAGNRATEDVDRFSREYGANTPQLVLLLEGANDINLLLATGGRDVTPIVGAMEEMVKDATYRGGQVMLATLPPQRPGGPKAADDQSVVDKYNRELRTMASKKGAILVDVNAQLPLSLIGQDGLHPTEAGYQKLAEIFLDAIKTKFETSPGGS